MPHDVSADDLDELAHRPVIKSLVCKWWQISVSCESQQNPAFALLMRGRQANSIRSSFVMVCLRL
jgi:hypothetical protein